MKRPHFPNRRQFLAAGAVAAAAGCGTNKSPWRFFTEAEAQTLAMICDQIIPADQDPGAAWAGVVNYIDRQLMGRYKEHQQVYREGIASANRLAGGSFATVSKERQFALLQKMMKKDKETSPFFSLAITHTMQGFYGNPRHGGNRDFVSWRMLGVPASPVRGRDQYDFTKGGKA
jgi:gluconate 2-dehydrogenase gamma chain